MNKSFYIGLSGSTSNQFGIDTIANNIANVNTVGFKGSTAEYSSLFSSVLTDAYSESTLNDSASGSRQNGTFLNMDQGSFQLSDRAFDLALSGEGWFGVKGTNNQNNNLYYTRSGSFSRDINGDMVGPGGNYLLGTSGNNIASTTLSQKQLEDFGLYYGKNGNKLGIANKVTPIKNIAITPVGGQTKINLPDILYYPPVPTTNISYHANLDPKVNMGITDITLNQADISSSIDTSNKTISVNGTISNTPSITTAVPGDTVQVTISDINGNQQIVNTLLDSELKWKIPDENISNLDVQNLITVSAQVLATPLNSNDITSTINNINETISIDGTIANTTGIQNPIVGDYVQVNVTDAAGKVIQISSQLEYPKALTQLSNNDTISTINTINQTISINGTTTNTPAASTAKEGDNVFIAIIDINGNIVNATANLDQNLKWTLNTKDISSLDTTNPLTVIANAEVSQENSTNFVWHVKNKDISALNTTSTITTTANLQTSQEIPNVEHSSTSIISPTGKKDILDMTYTKRVPQPANGSVWDASIQILSFYETYNPSSTYDLATYKVDKNAGKVYTIVDSQTGVVEFDGAGRLLTSTIPTMSNGGASLAIDVGKPNSFTGLVSNTNLNVAKTSYEKDPVGVLPGMLNKYGVDENGNVVAEFYNGKTVPVAKIAVYHFQNDQGLLKSSSNLFQESSNSGKPIFYTDVNGNFRETSKILSYKLENSNVDLSVALTELIAVQRSFDSSAKIITTSDQMIKNAINMKR
jgi:flagellar hook-basal body protein